MKSEVYNPYLPSYEYIPDGEPHVFGDRIYIYGSHDRFRGAAFCLNDYICYSANVDDLSQWKYEGVIYRKEQDPRNQNIPEDAPKAEPLFGIVQEKEEDLNPPGVHALYAPDVVKGLDGKFYLYYCLDCLPEIGVAVADSPVGPFKFVDFVRHKDGEILGRKEDDLIQFDPGIFIDEDRTIYLYSGNAPMQETDKQPKYSQVMTLEEDMVTLLTEPRKLIPSKFDSEGSGFEGHEFFEASSIRKINRKYYFVYSSINSHELCYAVSDFPDRDYRYGGTLVDIGDVYLNDRSDKETLNCLGNTHGGIELINGNWYVFYHRQTNRTNFSRQACAEKIVIKEDGTIEQTEVTSCGLNGKPLHARNKFPARICCHLTGKNGTTFSHPMAMKMNYPYLTQDCGDLVPTKELEEQDKKEPIQYIRNLNDGATAGYKYFQFNNETIITLTIRGKAVGVLEAAYGLGEKAAAFVEINNQGSEWITVSAELRPVCGVLPVYLTYWGIGAIDLSVFEFK